MKTFKINVLTALLSLSLFLLLVQPFYNTEERVTAFVESGPKDSSAVITIQGGTNSFPIWALGLINEKEGVRSWGFSGTIIKAQRVSVSSVEIIQDKNCPNHTTIYPKIINQSMLD